MLEAQRVSIVGSRAKRSRTASRGVVSPANTRATWLAIGISMWLRVAIAAIAPDRKSYEEFRATADKDPDFAKDYHAAKIFAALSRVNADFYPRALLPPLRQPDGTWHFENKTSGVLTKKQFERCYDRLGKHLHAQNPWGKAQNIQNIASDLQAMTTSAKELVAYHARFIRAPDFHGVWIVDAATPEPTVLNAEAKGPYALGAA